MQEQPKEEPEKGEWKKVPVEGGEPLDIYVGESDELPDIDELCRPPDTAYRNTTLRLVAAYRALRRHDPAAAAAFHEAHKGNELFVSMVRLGDALSESINSADKKPAPPFEQHELFEAVEAPPKPSGDVT